jgi:alpha-ketoglutarate-dependent taurine dioxygenase
MPRRRFATEGDMVMWDTRAVIHFATGFPLDRTVLMGIAG